MRTVPEAGVGAHRQESEGTAWAGAAAGAGGISLQDDVGAAAFTPHTWQSPFCNHLARTGGLQLTYPQPHRGKAGFSPLARSPLCTPPPTLRVP